jgi:hypothetical protein
MQKIEDRDRSVDENHLRFFIVAIDSITCLFIVVIFPSPFETPILPG